MVLLYVAVFFSVSLRSQPCLDRFTQNLVRTSCTLLSCCRFAKKQFFEIYVITFFSRFVAAARLICTKFCTNWHVKKKMRAISEISESAKLEYFKSHFDQIYFNWFMNHPMFPVSNCGILSQIPVACSPDVSGSTATMTPEGPEGRFRVMVLDERVLYCSVWLSRSDFGYVGWLTELDGVISMLSNLVFQGNTVDTSTDWFASKNTRKSV